MSEASQRAGPSARCVPREKCAPSCLHDRVTTWSIAPTGGARGDGHEVGTRVETVQVSDHCARTRFTVSAVRQHMEPLMTDRTRDPDPARRIEPDDARSIGGVPRESSHPMYPPSWIPEENLRQGFSGLNDRHRTADEGGPYRSAPPSDVERPLDRGFERGRYFGRGPKGYRRSDARLLEEISDRLMAHPDVDASDIEVKVEGGIATLRGSVENRYQKRIAEYVAEDIMGVDDVDNQLKVRHGFWTTLRGERASERQHHRPVNDEP
jgi:hypothetical protein